MPTLKLFATTHPLWFGLALTLAWLALLIVLMGLASGALRRPYGDAVTGGIARLAVTAGVLVLTWRLGWLGEAGLARLGGWQAWLLALAGLVYYGAASLYAFFGRVAFDFSSLAHSGAPDVLGTCLLVGLSEEVLFRGLILFALARAWGHNPPGLIAAVVFSALLFAVPHLLQIFTHRLVPEAALLLVLETVLTATWWGALVLQGGSIWPVVALHILGNTIVSLQSLLIQATKPPRALRREGMFSLRAIFHPSTRARLLQSFYELRVSWLIDPLLRNDNQKG